MRMEKIAHAERTIKKGNSQKVHNLQGFIRKLEKMISLGSYRRGGKDYG
jgi:hypothetical protein